MSNVIWDSYWMFIKISYTIKSIADFFNIRHEKLLKHIHNSDTIC